MRVPQPPTMFMTPREKDSRKWSIAPGKSSAPSAPPYEHAVRLQKPAPSNPKFEARHGAANSQVRRSMRREQRGKTNPLSTDRGHYNQPLLTKHREERQEGEARREASPQQRQHRPERAPLQVRRRERQREQRRNVQRYTRQQHDAPPGRVHEAEGEVDGRDLHREGEGGRQDCGGLEVDVKRPPREDGRDARLAEDDGGVVQDHADAGQLEGGGRGRVRGKRCKCAATKFGVR